MHIDSEVSPVCCKIPLHRHKFSNWCTVLERFSFYQVLFFSCVRLISFLVVSAKMSGWKICRIKLHRRPRKEIRISAQVWFQAVNGLCLAEFKQWPSGQMGDKFPPIFRSLRLAARHDSVHGEHFRRMDDRKGHIILASIIPKKKMKETFKMAIENVEWGFPSTASYFPLLFLIGPKSSFLSLTEGKKRPAQISPNVRS